MKSIEKVVLRTANVQAVAKALKSRVELMCGLAAAGASAYGTGDAALAGYFASQSKEPTKEAILATMKLMTSARAGNADAIIELNKLRVITIDNYVRATSNYVSFFEPVGLEDDETPSYENTQRREVKVKYVSEDGHGFRTTRAVRPKVITHYGMKIIESEMVEYKLWDPDQGKAIQEAARATVDISFDVANKLDKIAFDFLDGYIGAFVKTGDPVNRTYFPNSRVVDANLPTTNDLVLSDNSGATLFRLKVIRAIMKYCASWGRVFGTPIVPTGAIYVPSIDSTDMSEEIVPTGSTNNAIADGVLQDYLQFDYMRKRWTLIPDETIPTGKCYPVLNKPVGQYFTKTQFDKEWLETSERLNVESRGARKVIQFVSPLINRVNALRVTYKS